MDTTAPQLPTTDWREDYAYLIAMQAYVYGFPAIYYAKLRFGMVMRPAGAIDTPLNQFFHVPRMPDHTDQFGGSPYRDGLYSIAWLDLRQEPVVASAPAAGARYVSIQLAEFYSDVFGYVGPAVNQGRTQTCLIVAPDWEGTTPNGIDSVLRAPTPCVMAIARVATPGGGDLVSARAIQNQCFVKPFSAWRDQTEATASRQVLIPSAPDDPLADFRTMNAAMKENPPPAADAALIRQFGRVGLGPMADIALDALDESTRRGLTRALVDGPVLLGKVAKSGGHTRTVNHWFYGDRHWGRMAAAGDLLGRASPQAFSGIVEHWIEQSTKLRTFVDADGQDLQGEHRYLLHFAKNELPQAQAFWSITLYDERFNLADNPIGRYSIGDLSAGLTYEPDGSLKIYLQREAPLAEHAANWLPTPDGKFNLFLRTYLPEVEVREQRYAPPDVQRL